MKSNIKHIHALLLALFFCAISLHNVSALTRSFQKGHTVSFSVKKRIKIDPSPINSSAGTEAGLFDKESEDEKENTITLTLPIFNYHPSFDAVLPVKSFLGSVSENKNRINVHQPLFLVIHSIRI